MNGSVLSERPSAVNPFDGLSVCRTCARDGLEMAFVPMGADFPVSSDTPTVSALRSWDFRIKGARSRPH